MSAKENHHCVTRSENSAQSISSTKAEREAAGERIKEAIKALGKVKEDDFHSILSGRDMKDKLHVLLDDRTKKIILAMLSADLGRSKTFPLDEKDSGKTLSNVPGSTPNACRVCIEEGTEGTEGKRKNNKRSRKSRSGELSENDKQDSTGVIPAPPPTSDGVDDI